MRRLLVLLLLTGIIGYGALRLFQRSSASGAFDPWRTLPMNTALVIEFPRPTHALDALTNGSLVWRSFQQDSALTILAKWIGDVLNEPKSGSAEKPAMLAVIRKGGDMFAVVGLLPSSSLEGREQIRGVDPWTLSQLASGNVVVLRPDTLLPELHAAYRYGWLVLGDDPDVLEETLARADDPNAPELLGLSDARATLGAGADAHVLIRTDRARMSLSTWIRAEVFDRIPVEVGWAALDLRIRPEAMLISGVFIPQETDTSTISDPDLPVAPVLYMIPSQATQVTIHRKSALKVDPEQDSTQVWDLIGPSIAEAKAFTDGPSERTWLIMEVPDTTDLLDRLLQSRQDGSDAPEVYRGHMILPLASSHVLNTAHVAFRSPWSTVLDDHLVLSEGPDDLRTVIDAELDGRTLAKDMRVRTLMDRYATPAYATYWLDIGRGQDHIAALMKDSVAARLQASKASWNELGGILVQLKRSSGRTYISASIQHAPVEPRFERSIWTLALKTPPMRTPDVVQNHVNSTQELVIMDSTALLSLVSSNGKVLWEKQLDGPIQGPVRQADRYHNGKLQLLFNTAKKIHLIDRLGRDVEGFPVDLPASTSVPLAMFDYDGKKEERILITLDDGRVLNYDLSGKAVKGWSTPDIGAAPIDRVFHIRNKGRDHLLIADEDGKIHVFDRQGKVRYKSALTLGEGSRLLDVRPGSDIGTCTVLWVEKKGAVKEGTLNGKQHVVMDTPPATVAVYMEEDRPLILIGTTDTLHIERKGRGFDKLSVTGRITQVNAMRTERGQLLIQAFSSDGQLVEMMDAMGDRPYGDAIPARSLGALIDLDQSPGWELVTVTPKGELAAFRLQR